MYGALKAAAASPGVEIELIDFSRFQIPPARLEFPLSGLSRPSPVRPDAPVLWLGRAEFDGGHHVAVWATVRLRARRKVLVAAAAIPARREIRPAEVRLEERYVFPFGPGQALAPGDTAGRALRRPLAAGAVITPDLLMNLPDVRRGETTRVVLEDGPIRISFDAMAGAEGARGDAIVLVNPSSGQKFLGTVTERRQAVVHLSEKRS
jgi:flagella basal body P-ring formation protein FlgA